MARTDGKNVLIIIPTFNESENIRSIVPRVFAVLPNAHVLVVDDNSEDGTHEAVSAMQAGNDRLHLIVRAGKLGLGTAYIAGFKWALERSYSNVIQMDADHSHDPGYLPAFVEHLHKEDVVIGSRYVLGGGTKNWGLLRQLISRLGSLYARMLLGLKFKDFTGGFNGWRREVLEAIELDEVKSEGYSFQIELKYRAALKGFSICEHPIIFVDRRVGQSKMSSGIVLEAITRLWVLRRLRFQVQPKRALKSSASL